MIEIVELSAGNEGPVAERLAASIRATWPDLAASPSDRVTILVGVRTFREIDLIAFVELSRPRPLPAFRRRDGTTSSQDTIQAAVLIVEVKQLDASRFTVRGTQIFPEYQAAHARSVNAQVDDCTIAMRNFKDRYGLEDFYVHGVGWLTAVPPEQLAGVSPTIVGSDATWVGLLDAAAQQSAMLYGPKSSGYLRAIGTIRDVLVRKRVLTPRDRRRAESLCRDIVASDYVERLAAEVGTKQIRLTGRGGSGKTTTLALLAKRLATVEAERVLVLTFHKTLRGDIAHLIDALVDGRTVRARIRVETALTFFVDALATLERPLPLRDGVLDYGALSSALRDATRRLEGDPDFVALLREADPTRFDYQFVFIDEAQDWTDDERDFIRAFYGGDNVVVADGLEQLVRRQTPCDWNAGLARSARRTLHLGRSLRMTANLATFANAVAREAGFTDWTIRPLDDLPGGRIIVVEGDGVETARLFAVVREMLAAAGASPVDALTCVPPGMVRVRADGTREATCTADLRAAGMSVWDACDDRVRDEPPTDPEQWRVVQYDSCRGLEGWVTIAYGLDQLVAKKEKYPNLADGEIDTPENVARRWLMIALTRAVHTLIVTISDSRAPIVATLHAVTATLPKDVVEWTTAADCVRRLTPPHVTPAPQT